MWGSKTLRLCSLLCESLLSGTHWVLNIWLIWFDICYVENNGQYLIYYMHKWQPNGLTKKLWKLFTCLFIKYFICLFDCDNFIIWEFQETFQKIYFYCYLCVCILVCEWVPIQNRRRHQIPWNWRYNKLETPNTDAGTQTLVLWKKSKYSSNHPIPVMLSWLIVPL